MPKTIRPTDSELEILQQLWRLGPATVRQVHQSLERETAYTTVLKLMQIMLEKGLVSRDSSQRSHIYEAIAQPEATERQLVSELITKAFAGSARRLIQQALSAQKLSDQELAEIRTLIDQHERQQHG